MNLITYLRAGYPALAIISSEEARAEAEIAAVCTSLDRHLHAWSSTEGLVDTLEGRVTPCSDPLAVFHLLDQLFASDNPRHEVLLRDLQLHFDQSDPMLFRGHAQPRHGYQPLRQLLPAHEPALHRGDYECGNHE